MSRYIIISIFSVRPGAEEELSKTSWVDLPVYTRNGPSRDLGDLPFTTLDAAIRASEVHSRANTTRPVRALQLPIKPNRSSSMWRKFRLTIKVGASHQFNPGVEIPKTPPSTGPSVRSRWDKRADSSHSPQPPRYNDLDTLPGIDNHLTA